MQLAGHVDRMLRTDMHIEVGEKGSLEEQTEILIIKFTMDIGINVLKKEGKWDSYSIRPIDDFRHVFDTNIVKLTLQYDPNYKRWGARQN